MSEDEQRDQTTDEPVAAETPDAEAEEVVTQASGPAEGQAPTDTSAPASPSGDEARIAELERQLAAERDAATDYMQKWQRAVADFANFKRRAQQDQEQRDRLFAAQAVAPVLNALDSFERAFSTLPDSLRGYTWIEGVALVDYQLRRALDVQGIADVRAEPGQVFDPTRHQAVGEIETDQHPAGHIAVVLQKGYQANGLLIRPALVQVARAAQPTEPTPATGAAETPPAADTSAAPEETQPSGPAP